MSRPTTTKGSMPTMTRPVTSAPVNPGGAGQVAGRARFAVRAKAVRRASWRWKLGVPAVVLLLAAAWWFTYSGPVLVLKDVAVPGVPTSVAEEVRTAAQLPDGEQMVRLDLSAAQHRVAAIRTVRSATVSRSWPSTVTITVTLRTPVAVVKDSSGGLHLADNTGTAYADLTAAPENLPLVDADASKPAAVQAVVQVLSALPASLRSQVSKAAAKGPDAVTLTVGRATVVWGSAEESGLKVTVLGALRRANPTARHFDLSAPRSPSVG
jgi:cell division protein FtsQ